jgi:hypothetical protein
MAPSVPVSTRDHAPLLAVVASGHAARPWIHRAEIPDDYTIAELHAIATRALANSDEYERGLLRDQLMREEFGEEPEILPEAE